jgi:hypothetical protein
LGLMWINGPSLDAGRAACPVFLRLSVESVVQAFWGLGKEFDGL